jgi:hypothetical protein
MYSVLEINVGLICACGVVFPAFFDASAPRSLGSLVSSLLARRSDSQINVTSPRGSDVEREGSYPSSAKNSFKNSNR